MLSELYIKNYILIKELSIKFYDGFTVVTGETGAGKTIFLGALSLLLGERADTSIVSDEKCIIEGEFRIDNIISPQFFIENNIDYSDICIIRREILPTGKTRAFINDTPVTLSILKTITEKLIDIHSQHSTLLLSKNYFHLELIDAVAGTTELYSQYIVMYNHYLNLKEQIEQIKKNIQKQERELDYIGFLLNEISEFDPKLDEIESLESELLVLENAEKIKLVINEALTNLKINEDNIISKLQVISNSFSTIVSVISDIADLNDRLISVKIELDDIVQEISSLEHNIDVDPAKAETVKTRLDKLNNLLYKHKVNNLNELFELQEKFQNQVNSVDDDKEKLENLIKEIKNKEVELFSVAQMLSQKRHLVIPQLEGKVKAILTDLGMPNVVFKVKTTTINDITAKGIDNLLFLFSANKGELPQELYKVASGGEMSRLMLALKSIIAESSKLPTLIFDEIDTGISGEVAKKMAVIFKNMGLSIQLIAISHLPQVAAKANKHIIVEKSETEKHSITSMKYVKNTSRIEAIAKMLSGDSFSEETIQLVKKLIK